MNPIYGLRSEFSEFSKALQSLSIDFGNLGQLLRVVQDLKLAKTRHALGLTQAEMGAMIAYYTGRKWPYAGTTVAAWEWWEREGCETRPGLAWKYAAPARIREVYRALIAIAVDNVTAGRLMLCYHNGWHRHVIRAHCLGCSREFEPRDARHVRCSRCGHRTSKRGSQCRQQRSKSSRCQPSRKTQRQRG